MSTPLPIALFAFWAGILHKLKLKLNLAFSPCNVMGIFMTEYTNYGYKTEVLVASIRNPVHVLRAALM